MRLFERNGVLVFDSYLVSDRVEVRKLPPARKRGELRLDNPPPQAKAEARRQAEPSAALDREVRTALSGQIVVGDLRTTAAGGRVVSVSLPVQTVKARSWAC